MEHVPQLLIVEDENSFHQDHICWIDCDTLIGESLMAFEIVSRDLNDAGRLNILERLDGEIKIERVWMIEIVFTLKGKLLLLGIKIAIKAVLRQKDDLSLFVGNSRLTKLFDDACAHGSLAACCSTGDADKKRSFPFHTAVAESHLFGDENFTTPRRRRSAFTSVHCRENLGSPNEEAGGLEAFDMDPNVYS